MSKYVIGAALFLFVSGIGAGLIFGRGAPVAPPAARALASIPPPPYTAPVPEPKHADLPTVDVAARPVHVVPNAEPPPARPVTLRTLDGRPIDPESGRVR